MLEQTQKYLNNLLKTPPEEIDAEMALKLAYYALSDSRAAASARPEGAPGYHSLPQMTAALTGVCTAVREIYDSQIASLLEGSSSNLLKKKLEQAQADLAAIQAGTDGISSEIAALSGAEEALEAAQNEKRQALLARQAELSAKEKELAGELSQKQAEIDRQQQENDALRAEFTKKDAQRRALEAEVAALNGQLKAMDDLIAQAKAAGSQTENQRGRLKAFQTAVKALFASDVAKCALEQQQPELAALSQELSARIEETQQTVDSLRQKLSELVAAGEALTQQEAEKAPQQPDKKAEKSADEPQEQKPETGA